MWTHVHFLFLCMLETRQPSAVLWASGIISAFEVRAEAVHCLRSPKKSRPLAAEHPVFQHPFPLRNLPLSLPLPGIPWKQHFLEIITGIVEKNAELLGLSPVTLCLGFLLCTMGKRFLSPRVAVFGTRHGYLACFWVIADSQQVTPLLSS